MNLQDLYENLSSPQRAVKQLPANFQPANTSPQLSGPYPGRNATRGYLVGEDQELAEIYNPLDDERREQRAMDREREQFKRDELELELRGEEERMRAANEGTFYLRINGRIWQRAGEPVAFQGRARAVQAGQTIKDRDASREVVVTRRPEDAKPVAESRDSAYEDILTGLQKKLGDYLQDVATAVKRDPDLLDKIPKDRQNMQAVKTIRTDDGHEIKIHGNEDDGFRISIKNRDIKSAFRNLDEAEMACDLYCAQRRRANYIDEKSISESYSEEEYTQAMQDFLARGGKIEKGVYKEPKLATRLRRQGSRHIGKGSEGRAGKLVGRGANVGGTGKPVVSVEETKKDACYQKVKSRYKVWPSAYASGALVQCRKKGAANWGTKSKVTEGWRETLAGLAAAGIMALSPGISAADVAADSQQVPMIATIVVGGEVKKLDLTAKGFRDVREAEKFFDEFFGRRGMPWQGKIERGTPGSGQYQRLIVQ